MFTTVKLPLTIPWIAQVSKYNILTIWLTNACSSDCKGILQRDPWPLSCRKRTLKHLAKLAYLSNKSFSTWKIDVGIYITQTNT